MRELCQTFDVYESFRLQKLADKTGVYKRLIALFYVMWANKNVHRATAGWRACLVLRPAMSHAPQRPFCRCRLAVVSDAVVYARCLPGYRQSLPSTLLRCAGAVIVAYQGCEHDVPGTLSSAAALVGPGMCRLLGLAVRVGPPAAHGNGQ